MVFVNTNLFVFVVVVNEGLRNDGFWYPRIYQAQGGVDKVGGTWTKEA